MMHQRMNAPEVSRALANSIEQLAEHLLGPRNKGFSTALEWRWGNKGSISVVIKGDRAGKFFNHETGTGGDALELVKVTRGCGTIDAINWALTWLGAPEQREMVSRPAPLPKKTAPDANDTRRAHIAAALRIWEQTKPVVGTIAETYLQHRSIADLSGIEDLRFHPACSVKTISGDVIALPAMVGLLRTIVGNEPVAIHRTFLRADGAGKVNVSDCNIKAPKMMLGPSAGAMIKLCPDDEVEAGLGICEGIENALTMLSRGWRPIWAAPDVGHVRLFPVLDGIERLTIFADNKKANDLSAANECAARWTGNGRRVTVNIPPDGADWNDIAAQVAA